jgi:hypothetical protein
MADDKDLPWAEAFAALGVVYDIVEIRLGKSTIANKPNRAEKAVAMILQFIAALWASTKDLESTRGKLQYIEAQVFGKAGKSALTALRRTRGCGKKFTSEDVDKMKWIIEWLNSAVPRPISPSYKGPPLILFTDGACEGYESVETTMTTCGAVLLDRRDNSALVFGIEINKTLQAEWRDRGGGKKQLVTEAELLPVLLARRLWQDRIRGTKLIAYVDSNPAKFSLIRGTSESCPCEDIVRSICLFDCQSVTWPWYSRVPTKSNIADGPSRLKFPKSILNFKVVICNHVPQPSSLVNGIWADL